jgi:hypothetical protein
METVQCSECKLDLAKSCAVHSFTYDRSGHGPWDVYHCRPCAEASCKQCVCSFESAVPKDEHFARANHPWVPLVPRLICCSRCGAWGKDLIRRPDGQCDHCAREQKTPVHTPDVFAHTYPQVIESVFKTLRPRSTTPIFELLRTMYIDNPSRVRVISGIHQNSIRDRLHMSLAVDCGKTSYTIHIYGFWKTFFRVHSVTMKDKDDIHTVAEF